MNEQRAPRRKETFLVLFMAIAAAFGLTLFALMITGRFFFAFLGVGAGMIVLGFLQYVIWGRPMKSSRRPAQRETMHYPR